MEQRQQYQLGSWVVCPRTNTIANEVETHSIDNKTMLVLLFLIKHAGEQVTKGQIIEGVWQGSVVADDILSVAISKIRKALGDNARSPTYIKTLPNIGYCLIANVDAITQQKRPVEPEQTKEEKPKSRYILLSFLSLLLLLVVLSIYFYSTDENPQNSRININSIAVLPFDDLSASQDNQYFSEGLSDAIINQLSQIQRLKVISRYSSFNYRENYNTEEVGRALQVDSLLDGSVQKIGEQVRINVRIFSTKDGQQLWSRTFDSNNQDIFKLQDNISGAIKEIIQPGTEPAPEKIKTISAQAYEWYLMGQYHWRQRNPKSLSQAVTYFQHSIELEPNYADAHTGLAITYAYLHHHANWHEKDAVEKALPHLAKALELSPNSSIALAAKGMILDLKATYDFGELSIEKEAREAFLQSLALENNATTLLWYSAFLKRQGEEDKVVQHMNQALELNPLSASLKRAYSGYLYSIGKPDSAQRLYQRASILEPNHFSHVIAATHIFRNTQDSIYKLAQWQTANADLFTNCASIEYCEQVVLAYLSIGATNVANLILEKMGPKHGHFRRSLRLVEYGLANENQKIIPIFQRLAEFRNNNRKSLYDLAHAQFRVGNYTAAKTSLLQSYPELTDKSAITQSYINADNYLALLLYAATIAKLDQQDVANALLENLKEFLKQGTVFDKIQAEFALAEINAQLGNTNQAIRHLATALNMGWVETYDKEWWPLQNNHLLQPLAQEPEFRQLLNQHQEALIALREKVNRLFVAVPVSN